MKRLIIAGIATALMPPAGCGIKTAPAPIPAGGNQHPAAHSDLFEKGV